MLWRFVSRSSPCDENETARPRPDFAGRDPDGLLPFGAPVGLSTLSLRELLMIRLVIFGLLL